jgi:predicted amidohydrolase
MLRLSMAIFDASRGGSDPVLPDARAGAELVSLPTAISTHPGTESMGRLKKRDAQKNVVRRRWVEFRNWILTVPVVEVNYVDPPGV